MSKQSTNKQNVNAKLGKIARDLKMLSNAAMGFAAGSGSTSDLDWSGQTYLLNHVALGDGTGNRTGTSIVVKRIKVSGVVRSMSTAERNVVRIMLVRIKQPDTLIPDAADILTDATDESTPFQSLNWYNKERFVVHYDKKHDINISTQNNNQFMFNIDIRGSWPVRFNSGTAGTGADLETNAFYMIAVSETDPADSDGPFLRYARSVEFLQ